MNSGDVITFDETAPLEIARKALLATAAIPAFIESVNLDGKVLVDGQVFSGLNMEDAITKCRELGFEDENIIVDAILCLDDKYAIKAWPESLFRYKTA